MTFCRFKISVLFKLAIVFSELYPSHNVNYCNLPCGDTANTGCQYCAYAPMCRVQPGYFEYAPKDDDRTLIVDTHNQLRYEVTLGHGTYKDGVTGNKTMASDMYIINYDTELEHVAICWARQCTGYNDMCRRTLKFDHVGQNLFSEYRHDCDSPNVYYEAIYSWFMQIKDTNFACINYVHEHCLNQFIQVVWATTKYVGCGKVRFNSHQCYIVCNYGPTGNVIGESVYKAGPPATHCPPWYFLPNKNKDYVGLCGYTRTDYSYVHDKKCSKKHIYFLGLSCLIYIILS